MSVFASLDLFYNAFCVRVSENLENCQTRIKLMFAYLKHSLLVGVRRCLDCLGLIVGEPKSPILQKHTFFAPKRYTAGILYTDSLNSA